MSRLIEFWLEPNERYLHKDFIMHIRSLNKYFRFDTYYFWDGDASTDNYKSLTEVIGTYLKKCSQTILSISKEEKRYIPIDFSDQYYGCFCTRYYQESDKYVLNYVVVESRFTTIFNETENDIDLVVTNEELPTEFSLSMTKDDVLDSFVLIPSVLSNRN